MIEECCFCIDILSTEPTFFAQNQENFYCKKSKKGNFLIFLYFKCTFIIKYCLIPKPYFYILRSRRS